MPLSFIFLSTEVSKTLRSLKIKSLKAFLTKSEMIKEVKIYRIVGGRNSSFIEDFQRESLERDLSLMMRNRQTPKTNGRYDLNIAINENREYQMQSTYLPEERDTR